MEWIQLAASFFGGAFLINAVPHLVAGLSGRAFQTPFAKPPGKGYSSSTVNFWWGLANLAVGYLLFTRWSGFAGGGMWHELAALAGGIAIGLPLARAFGDIHGGNTPPAQGAEPAKPAANERMT